MATIADTSGYDGAMTTTESTTRWLDDVEMRAWRTFIETFDDLQRALEADLVRDQDLSIGDYQVLVFLSEAEDHRHQFVIKSPPGDLI